MLYIIAFVVIAIIAVAIIKAVGGAILSLVGGILKFFFTAVYLTFFGLVILCERIFFHVTKFLHIQGLSYLVLGLCTPWNIAYYLFVHLPYSFKEMSIKNKEFFKTQKAERYKTIGMSAFLCLPAVLFIVFLNGTPLMEEYVPHTFYILASLIYTVYKTITWIRTNRTPYKNYIAWKKWTKGDAPNFVDTEIQEKIEAMVLPFVSSDVDFSQIFSPAASSMLAASMTLGTSIPTLPKKRKVQKTFTSYNMVYGRANAFLSYFGRNVETDEPLFFCPQMSPSEEELREYGILISNQGIYLSQYEKADIAIPFEGLWKLLQPQATEETKNESLTVDYGLDKTVRLEKSKYYDIEKIKVFLEILIETKIPLALLKGQVTTELEQALSESEKLSTVNKAQQQFDRQQNLAGIGKVTGMGGIYTSVQASTEVRTKEIKNYMDGARGGGYAAEYGNNAIDRLRGYKVENLAQQLDESGRQIKGGADRMVNGVQIQTKYYQTASESVGAAFEHKQAIYTNPDGTMMTIEVPKGQGKEAIELMKKRINSGQVPGETNPDNAKNYVKEGYFTYFQANNIAIAGTIEGLTADAAQGIVCSIPGAGFSSVISFASAVWQGQDLKDAAKASMRTGLLVIGKGTLMNVITMQVSRDKLVNFFKIDTNKSGIARSFGSFKNPVRGVADKAAGSISTSKLAKSTLGKKVGLNNVTGTKLIGGAVTTAVVFGPDICKAYQGKISGGNW